MFKPFEKNIPKAEVEYLLRDQNDYNSTDYLLGQHYASSPRQQNDDFDPAGDSLMYATNMVEMDQ